MKTLTKKKDMSKNNNDSTPSFRHSGVGFLGLLTILFIGLKLTNHIDWSWWLVLMPIIALPSILLGVTVFALIIWLIASAVEFFAGVVESARKGK